MRPVFEKMSPRGPVHPYRRFRAAVALAFFALLHALSPAADAPNTQEETIPLLSPQKALAGVRVAGELRASLFAAEPDVRQPIAMTFDTRGRLWVAECDTYAEDGAFDLKLHDRIVILEDRDGDGRAETRTVFWDQAQRLTSIEMGFGGVWAMCTPELLFIPDADSDGRPDGEPVVVLDGFVPCGHTLANGLRWGPDGWLYGRHGIQGTSRVGAPGTDDDGRVPINCGIWRYHPQRKTFEVVSHGTTNPWGMDWNDHGELFFINTVIGHLWHAIPGAHFRRMYGEDLRPGLYERIEQAADHVHWDEGKEDWTAQAKGMSGGTDHAGGGHAHVGMMFYLGGNWPEHFRDGLFTLNLHGRRINHDHIIREGATYTGKHRPDVAFWDDKWFRGIELGYGPDGGVFVLDWSDIGECHEADGLHRTSGRIYKIDAPSGARSVLEGDLADRSDSELADLQLHPNEWFVRQARRVLHERAAGGRDLSAARAKLHGLLETQTDIPRKLRALWALHVTGGVGDGELVAMLRHGNEHLRAWAVRLLVDGGQPTGEVRVALAGLAETEESGLVLTYLASALQRFPAAERFAMAASISRHDVFADDRVLPLMVWYGIEEAVSEHPALALDLVKTSRMPRLVRHVSRRLTEAIGQPNDRVAGLLDIIRSSEDLARVSEVLAGMAAAVRGWSEAPAPAGWAELADHLQRAAIGDPLLSLVRELSIVFGEGLDRQEIFRHVLDPEAAAESRRQALRSLAASRATGIGAVLERLLDDPALVEEAVRGLAAVDLPHYAPLLVESYPRIDGSGKDAVVEVLATRADTALRLIDAVERGTIPAGEVDTFLLRQMQLGGDQRVIKRIAQAWPEQPLIAEDKLRNITRLRGRLTPEALASASLAEGQILYGRLCGQCHKLFGNGGDIGPELTGGQRAELGYWLENILDPSAVIPENYQVTVVTLDDGRQLSGMLGEETPRTLTLKTPGERLVLERKRVASLERLPISLMPEGLIDGLNDAEVVNLSAYLMSPGPLEPDFSEED